MAFTLLEVLIAMAIFFLAAFAVLELTTRSLRSARSLQSPAPSASVLAADIMNSTNKLEEGTENGDFEDLYPEYRWQRVTSVYSTNGLFQIDFWVYKANKRGTEAADLSILLWRPDSVAPLGRSR
jgi:general secretion pathway protein I